VQSTSKKSVAIAWNPPRRGDVRVVYFPFSTTQLEATMLEGWHDDDYLILFDESEVAAASDRCEVLRLLPGFKVLGLRSWDDFIVGKKRAFRGSREASFIYACARVSFEAGEGIGRDSVGF
jgi:hypothetical protein